ncbi:FAD-dependent oxidoreductase [uncultured Eudoraea sp.]|uniref:FAD-dependent oxidoreductase n=1 Tax=uncultured Eudoraea sp. TaxID=1035614 RepID=UPI002633AA85|nr:FAD-dependent oxidoreductase [uncultured Eudoraea sp.]
MRVAIIGGGAAGMITAYLLNKQGHDVEVFEKSPVLGGNIITLNKNATPNNSDSDLLLEGGVIEFSNSFVYFKSLLDELDVCYEPVNIGTGVFYKNGAFILSSIMSRKNFRGFSLLKSFTKLHLLYLKSILLGIKLKSISLSKARHLSLKTLLGKDTTSTNWLKLFMMYSYSTDYRLLDDFSSEIALQNIKNYMLAGWFRIPGGVYTYIEKIIALNNGKFHINSEVRKVLREDQNVILEIENGERLLFDKVVLAIPPHQILNLLQEPTSEELFCLQKWKGNKITTIIHQDDSLYKPYPIKRPSEFDFFETKSGWGYNAILNYLCGIDPLPKYFLSYNLESLIDSRKIIHVANHETPLYSQNAVQHRSKLISLNGHKNTYFAGAWLDDGLHEGATISAMRVADLIK